MVVLPEGMTLEQARAFVRERIDAYHADDVWSIQVLGAAVVREHDRLVRLEELLRRSPDDLHVISEVQKYLTDLRHESARTKGHMHSRRLLIERWGRKLKELEAGACDSTSAARS